MSQPNPRYPAPENVSPDARAFLAQPVDMSQAERPAPSSLAEWDERINETNTMIGAVLEERLKQAPISVAKGERAGVTVREVTPDDPHPERSEWVLMNLHGGGYTMLGGDVSIMEALDLARDGFRVVSVDYRMPPRHPFPAAVDDGVAVYRELLRDHSPARIAVYGSSAGGALSASVILAARDQGLPLPAAAVLHTPWSDLARIGDSYATNEGVDPMLPSYSMLDASAQAYANGTSLDDPLLSPVYGDFGRGFPPALLSTGTRDLLLSCTIRLHRAMRAAGVAAELHVFDAMWHAFPLFAPEEGKELHRETVAFLDRHLGA